MKHLSRFLRLRPNESEHLEITAYFLAGFVWTKPQTTLEICLQKKPTLVDGTLKSPLKKF